MADKKISELPLLNSVSGSSMIIPVVHDGTTVKVNLSQIGHYASQWSAKTGSANTFAGTQTFSGNVNINGRLTVHEIYANYETSSILYTSGSSQFGDQTSDVHTFVGTILLNGSALGDSGINSFTASQLAVNLGISSVTGSINTTTSSFDSVFQRISSTTGSINTTTSSFDLVFRGISSVTGAINTTTSSFDTVFERISSTTGSINTTTSSFDLVFQGISSVTGAINTTTSSFDSVFVRISSTTGSINTTTSSFDLVFRGISSVTGAMNTQSSSQDLVNRQVSLVTGSIHFVTGAFNAFTGSVVGQTNTIATFTSSVNFATQSLNTQTGSQDLVNFRIASTTGSINTTTSSFDLVFRGISSVTGAMNTQSSSQDLVNRGISSVTGSINTTTSSFDLVFRGISSVTGAINLTTSSLIGITNGLMAFTAALDNTYATDAQLYQLYQATASVHFTTQSLNTQTGSQDLINLGISTFTGSLRSELDLIEAYTASLKAQAIVSSSQQIIDYNTFALTSSANVFFGKQSVSGALHVANGITGSVKGNLDGVANYASTIVVVNTGTTTDTTLYPTFTTSPILAQYTSLYSHASSSFFYNGVTRRLHMEGFVVSGSNNIAEISGSLNVSGSSHTIQNGYVILQQVSQSLNYVDDAAAAAAGVPLGGLYRNGNFIVIRIS